MLLCFTALVVVNATPVWLVALVVARDADVRRYVRECLRERPDLRVVEAATTSAAMAASSGQSPDLLVVDETESTIVKALPGVRAIVITDDVPRDEADRRVRFVARPFSAEVMQTEISRLLR